jgi:hypothetical protein
MNLSQVRKALTRCVALALLAGCGGSQPPVGAPGAMPEIESSLPLPAGRQGDLVYIADLDAVYVFTYPKWVQVETLGALPDGLCSDKKGDVFVPIPEDSMIFETDHGGTKVIARLYDDNESPLGCAVNPVTGDLAVTNADNPYSAFVTYRHARGNPTSYTIPNMGADFCTYDDKGNLFIDGGNNGQSLLAELPYRSQQAHIIEIDRPLAAFGGVQWDGRHLALGTYNAIYQLDVAGAVAHVVGVTYLAEAKDVVQFFIQGNRIIGPDLYAADVGIWKYPSGGEPLSLIYGLFSGPTGATVSLAPK